MAKNDQHWCPVEKLCKTDFSRSEISLQQIWNKSKENYWNKIILALQYIICYLSFENKRRKI